MSKRSLAGSPPLETTAVIFQSKLKSRKLITDGRCVRITGTIQRSDEYSTNAQTLKAGYTANSQRRKRTTKRKQKAINRQKSMEKNS